MMAGRMAYMELRTGWKGLLIFGLLILVVSAGMVQIFPTFRDSLTEELEGANKVSLELPDEQGGNVTLSWESMENATSYMVLEDSRLSMVTAKLKYKGEETSITFEKDFEEKRYYAVTAVLNETSDPLLIGIATTEEGENPFQELLQNPIYKGFTGGRNVNMLEAKGFITLEFFSWWWMLAGMFIAYLSVSVIASDFENKHMDVLLSTPISRRRYLIEKFGAMTVVALLIILVATAGIAGGLTSINALNEFSADVVFLSLIGCLPFLMVIAAVGVFTAVLFQKVRASMGVTFAFVFAEFFLYAFGGFSKSLEWMKTISIFQYWDYASVIIDDFFKAGDFIVLTILALVLLIIGIWVFEKKDIPA
ncbi:MAG: ABC transporter permease [Candidatus Bathyarchaeota archaeon]|nr:ABC transporter permease [Candidatus Bathyarchaeota archaeon]MDH5733699.1 ABC transporter permease [Candidatus Bathyarchaeota archaeon]